MREFKILLSLTLLALIVLVSQVQDETNDYSRSIASERDWTAKPVRLIEDLKTTSKEEQVAKLKDAKVVYADYDLIRYDFPELRNLANPDIDQWLLDNTGYISLPQAAQETVNTKIPVTDQKRVANRPSGYGRALVYSVNDPSDSTKSIGLIDVKGTGALAPAQKDHGNGLMTLGESIREALYEKAVRYILNDAKSSFGTIGSYAVIDPGFNMIHADGTQSRAGIYLRQAHKRTESSLTSAYNENMTKLLARYGIDVDRNMQKAANGFIYDFGHYVTRDDLPGINADKALPINLWGYDKAIKDTGQRWFYSKEDYPWRWSHNLAEDLANGKASRDDVWKHFQNLLGPVESRLDLKPIQASGCLDLLQILGP
jgi:hypothetical protein